MSISWSCSPLYAKRLATSWWSTSADDAIDRIAVSGPDVVLIDNPLQSGSGIDVIRAIRLMGPVPGRLLLAMSNALNRTVREASLAAGADEYFDKTIDHGKLLARIAALAFGLGWRLVSQPDIIPDRR